MIRDQRHMQGARRHATVDDVVGFWRGFASNEGFIVQDGLRDVGPLFEDSRVVDCYVSDSRLVATCPECNGGIACWQANPRGCCLDCGHVYEIRFPDDLEAGLAVLLARDDVKTRNWNAHRGETVDDLKVENLTRGVPLTSSEG